MSRSLCCTCGASVGDNLIVGGPPLCKDCYEIVRKHSDAFEAHKTTYRKLCGIEPIDLGIMGKNKRINDELLSYAEALADFRMNVHGLETRLFNMKQGIISELEHIPNEGWKPQCWGKQTANGTIWQDSPCRTCTFGGCADATADARKKRVAAAQKKSIEIREEIAKEDSQA